MTTDKHFFCQYCLKSCYNIDIFRKVWKILSITFWILTSCCTKDCFSVTGICWLFIWNCTSYLELAILPCWRFLLEQPLDSLRRLVMMIRGLGDPVASAYCRLYMAHCAQKLPSHDIGIFVDIMYLSLRCVKM